jgi:hypothetical protein
MTREVGVGVRPLGARNRVVATAYTSRRAWLDYASDDASEAEAAAYARMVGAE